MRRRLCYLAVIACVGVGLAVLVALRNPIGRVPSVAGKPTAGADDPGGSAADRWSAPGGAAVEASVAPGVVGPPAERVLSDGGSEETGAHPGVLRSREMRLGPAFRTDPLTGRNGRPVARRFEWDLFDDVRLTGWVDWYERLADGRGVYHGAVEGVPGGRFLLSYDGRAIAGAVDLPGRASYQLRPIGQDRVRVAELDPAQPLSCGVGEGVVADGGNAAMARAVARVADALRGGVPLPTRLQPARHLGDSVSRAVRLTGSCSRRWM